jgi:hypothetical protein
MDRRAIFFVGAALASFLMIPVGLENFQYVAVLTGIVYLVLAALSFLDRWSRGRAPKR